MADPNEGGFGALEFDMLSCLFIGQVPRRLWTFHTEVVEKPVEKRGVYRVVMRHFE
jgi:hypothetical protein